jgi:hypothetical protein
LLIQLRNGFGIEIDAIITPNSIFEPMNSRESGAKLSGSTSPTRSRASRRISGAVLRIIDGRMTWASET